MEKTVYYKYDLLNLQPGDILLSRGEGAQAKIISSSTGGNFSHAMLYVGGSVIHADGSGVYSKNPQRIYAKNKGDLAVYRLIDKLSPENSEEVCKAARAEVGKLYDIKGAISSVLPGENRSNEDRQFCSKLVAVAFAAAQINFSRTPDKITPNDFCDCDLLELKSDLVVSMDDEDVAFAKSPDYNLELQVETFDWLLRVRAFAQERRSRIIGSINNVFEYLIDFPEDDELFCKIIDESRYYSFAELDVIKNPYRYDVVDFKNHLSQIKTSDREMFFQFEFFSLGEEISFRERNYLWAIRLMAEQDLKFFKKNYDLAKKLYVNATTRAFVINVLDNYKKFCEDLLKSDQNQN